jgi:hypothetical protein
MLTQAIDWERYGQGDSEAATRPSAVRDLSQRAIPACSMGLVGPHHEPPVPARSLQVGAVPTL